MSASRKSNPSLFENQLPLEHESSAGGIIAGIYIRVSTLNQVDHDSLSTQESRLRAYCRANEFNVGDVYKDSGISAKDTDRPELKRLMEDCRNGRIHAVVVTALDRITRSLRDLIRLVDFFAETKVRFISITQNIDSESPFGRFMRDLLGLIARLERETGAVRVATDMHHRALLGKWNGGMVPYGYTTQQRILKEMSKKGLPEAGARLVAAKQTPEPKKLYIDPQEAEVIKKIFEIFIETRSLRKTANFLNSLGIKPRHSNTWAVATIHKILTHPVRVGKISYGKTKTDIETGKLTNVNREEWKEVLGQHQPIVSEKLHNQVEEILKSGSRKPTRARHEYLLSGLLRCGKCGGSMYGATFTRKSTGKTYRYYKCDYHEVRGNSVCKGLSIPADHIEDFVVKTLLDLYKDRPFIQNRARMLAELKRQMKPETAKKEIEAFRKEERNLAGQIDKLMDGWNSGLFKKEDFTRKYSEIKAQQEQNRKAQEKMSDSVSDSVTKYDNLNASYEEICSFGKNWEYLDERSRATKIATIVKEIRVGEDNNLHFQLFLDHPVEEASTGHSHH